MSTEYLDEKNNNMKKDFCQISSVNTIINLHTLVHLIKENILLLILSMMFNEASRTFTHVSNIGHKLSKVTGAI